MSGDRQIIPQASSLPRLIAIVTEIHTSEAAPTVSDLARKFGIWPRTIAFYLDAGRWLGLVQAGCIELTAEGQAFASSSNARSRLFIGGLTRHKMVREVMGAHRAGSPLLAACVRVMGRSTDLAASTVKRRSSNLAGWLAIALKPSELDWETGEPRSLLGSRGLGVEGRSFITALTTAQFGGRVNLEISFPSDLRILLGGTSGPDFVHALTSPHFRTIRRGTTSYSGVPLTPEVLELWRRQPGEFRKVVVAYCPFISLATICLRLAHEQFRNRSLALVDDLWGVQFWLGGAPIGGLVEIVSGLGAHLGARVLPPRRGDQGTDRLLVELLLELQIAARQGTRVVLSRRFRLSLAKQGWADVQWGGTFGEFLAPTRRWAQQWIASFT